MDISDFNKDLTRLADVLRSDETRERINLVGVLEIWSLARIRIFEDGRATNGAGIGKYSTTPIYAGNRLGLPAIKPRGKAGNTKKANGDSYKTRYFKGGYKEYRDHVGRQNSKVDLNLTSSLFGAYRGGVDSQSRGIIGITSLDESKKMDANEKRFNKIIAPPTDSEINAGLKSAEIEIIEIINEIFR